MSRVFLQFAERFWEKKGFTGRALTDLPIMRCLNASSASRSTRGILETYVTGKSARSIADMERHDQIDFALKYLSKVFPNLHPYFETGASKCWDSDPWSRGAYCWFQPGQETTLWPELSFSEGRIHFAGDHTSFLPGWSQGALASGQRAWREIVEAETARNSLAASHR